MAPTLDYEPRTPPSKKLTFQIAISICATGIAVATLAFHAKQIFDGLSLIAPCTGVTSVLFGGIAAWSCLTIEVPQPAIVRWMYWLDITFIVVAMILMAKAMASGD